MGSIKRAVKNALPSFILRHIKRYRARKRLKTEYGKLSTKQVFTKIYTEGAWGKPGSLFSGTGSHVEALVKPYLEAAQRALRQIAAIEACKPDAVDLGCGDFSVGSLLRPLCGAYIGCDIVESVIVASRKRYPDVDFRVLDITTDDLPAGDVVFVRQVLQHLSNTHITDVLPKLARYKYLILTEHLPGKGFTPNREKMAGPHIRLEQNSGVVLTEPPFNLKPTADTCLCEVVRESDASILRTNLYKLR
jgi:Methyltransferase domain